MVKQILKIQNLHAAIQGVTILKGLNLTVNSGEVHAIMGPNGSGKSTLAKVIAGHPSYNILDGKIVLDDQDITQLSPDSRSHLGIFLAFQYPVEIPGVSNIDFLRLAYNEKRKTNNLEELDPLTFFNFVCSKLDTVKMDSKFLTRNVNEGFSGGEKKRNEILQMTLLENQLTILDETDSGLDVDALKTITSSVKQFHSQEKSMILITHYQRLLDYITPDFVHIMLDGKIEYTGTACLAKKIEENGYDLLKIKY
uniref:Probable ATP-dependent transporter ycf16 n=1 Tax=Kumanoa americana TaxID=1196377 RepID=A0A1C9CGG5_9FLOR|nr:iron-sulfur cluster formation ABC transporter ATP-binding subunit [Kumanoa americana]AOM67483.1 iron-sulfur cluster formation ABC transporter ATP-binding subunit [Kumanoa americana]